MAKGRPRKMVTPLQLFKQWESIREYVGDKDGFEMLINERDEQWRLHVINERYQVSRQMAKSDPTAATRDAERGT